jgi:hypothetical protein
MSNAFSLPKMTITDKYDYDRDEILKELHSAPTILTFYKTKDGEYRFLFTGFGQEELIALVVPMNRHIHLFNFMKSAMISIEKLRNEDLDAQDFMLKAIEFIRMNKSIINI